MNTRMHTYEKIRGSINRKTLLYAGVPFLIVVIAALIFILKPFQLERMQIEDLQGITKSEKEADSLSSQFGDYVQREKELRGIVAPSVSAVAQTSPMGYTAFTADEIAAESEKSQNNPFFSEIRQETQIATVMTDFQFFYSKFFPSQQ